MFDAIRRIFQSSTRGKTGLVALLLMLVAVPAIVGLPAVAGADPWAAENSTTCAKQLKPSSTKPGENIVKAVFASINTVLDHVGKAMYQGIVDNDNFQNVLKVTLTLYVAIYGVMVFLGLAEFHMREVSGRLIRIAIVYGLLWSGTTGWVMFDKYFADFFLGGMNELIYNFAVAAGVPVLPPVTVSVPGWTNNPALDPAAVSALYAPMNVVYQPFFIFAIIGMLFLNIVCTIMAFAMMWAFWDFTMMILGALITYVRAIVGLAFLFGIGPLFIIFLLFHQTRALFLGWINQMLSFAIAPVLLFAFLSFYTVLLTTVLTGMFVNVDFCWGKKQSLAGTTSDIGMWVPAKYTKNPTGAGSNSSWVQINGDWKDANGFDLPPPISIVSVLLFVLICHLGKNFSQHINNIATKISGGIGPGVVSGPAVSQFISGKLGGGGGIGSQIGNVLKGAATGKPPPTVVRPAIGAPPPAGP